MLCIGTQILQNYTKPFTFSYRTADISLRYLCWERAQRYISCSVRNGIVFENTFGQTICIALIFFLVFFRKDSEKKFPWPLAKETFLFKPLLFIYQKIWVLRYFLVSLSYCFLIFHVFPVPISLLLCTIGAMGFGPRTMHDDPLALIRNVTRQITGSVDISHTRYQGSHKRNSYFLNGSVIKGGVG